MPKKQHLNDSVFTGTTVLLFFCTSAFLIAVTSISQAQTFSGNIKQAALATDFSVSNIKAEASEKIKVTIRIPSSGNSSRIRDTWLRIFGLPEKLKFTKGALINKIWFVPAKNFSELYISAPANYSGQFQLDFFLMRKDNSIVSIVGKKKISVTITRAKIPPKKVIKKQKKANTPTVASIRPNTRKTKKKIQTITVEEETILLNRGIELMNAGSYSTARLIFQELAEKGSAKGALAMARTYDPNIIRESNISSIKSDPEKARKWYLKAKELGSTSADNHLQQLRTQ